MDGKFEGMKVKIAIISDIHANLEALKATFEDIEKRNVDKVICLGDIIAKGVHPVECLNIIREKCDVVLRGNCDRYFSEEHEDILEKDELEQKRIKYIRGILTEDERKYLLNLPVCYEFYMSGSLIRFFHATPDRDDIAVVNLNPIEDKYRMFLPSRKTVSNEVADCIIYGHIHHPYMDRLYNKTLINVGSVGNSFDVIRNDEKDSNILETTKSNYLIVEGDYGSEEYTSDISYQFIRVPYDIEKELEDEYKNIEKENYRFELLKGKYRNMSKINDNLRKIGVDVDKI